MDGRGKEIPVGHKLTEIQIAQRFLGHSSFKDTSKAANRAQACDVRATLTALHSVPVGRLCC